jgi:hypothetical protein
MTNDNGIDAETYLIDLAKIIGPERALEIVAEEQAKSLMLKYRIKVKDQLDKKNKIQVFMPHQDRDLIIWYLEKENVG